MTYEERHAKRYALSIEALRPHLRAWMHVLECGPRSSFAQECETAFGAVVADTGTADLRHPLPETIRGPYDAVLCMEVFEHIHDREPVDGTVPTEWRGTGTSALLHSVFQCLRPGGLLFLTTPNACSLNALYKALSLHPPMVYRPHVREYGPHELAQLVRAAGFERIAVAAHDVWDNDCMMAAQARALRAAIASLNYRSDCRGEDLFLTAWKPSATDGA